MERPDFIHRSGNDDFAGGGRRMELFKTIAGPASTPYPEEGDPDIGTQPTVYYAQMVKQVRYSAIPGVRTLQYSLTNYKTHVFNLASETYIEEGSVVAAWEMGGLWYTIDKVPPSGVEYFLVTSSELIGRKFNQVTDVFRVAHGQLIGGNGNRLPMVADSDHVWIPRFPGSGTVLTDGIFKFTIKGAFVTSFNAGTHTPAVGQSQHFNGLAHSPSGTFGAAGLFNTSTERVRAFADGGVASWGDNPGPHFGGKCAFDSDGNLYAIYGSIPGGSITRINKYDPSGSLVWASDTTGIGTNTYTSIAVDLEGNILVGHSAPFGLGTKTLAKYDGDGTEIWSLSRGTLGYDVRAIAVTPDNDIVVAGSISTATTDGVAKKYDAGGNELESDTYADCPLSNVACDHQGRVVFCGRGLTFGTGLAVTYDNEWNGLQSTSDGGEEFDGCCCVGGLVTEWAP